MTPGQYFRLVDVQARMLLKADASKFTLGYLWWFLEPLMWVSVFYVVFNLILDSGGRKGGDFLLFLACGKFAFLWFSKSVIQASNSIFVNQGLVGKINMHKDMFPVAEVLESSYRQAAVYLLLIVIVIAFGHPVTLTWFWLLPLIAVFGLMIIACGLIGAYVVCILRDFAKLIPLAMTFLLFTSGIFWDVRALGDEQKTELLLTINPLAFILDAHRQILLYQTPPDVSHLLLIGLSAIAIIILMVSALRRNGQYLALKVLT